MTDLAPYKKQYPKEEAFLVTTDGQVFLEKDKSSANSHQVALNKGNKKGAKVERIAAKDVKVKVATDKKAAKGKEKNVKPAAEKKSADTKEATDKKAAEDKTATQSGGDGDNGDNDNPPPPPKPDKN